MLPKLPYKVKVWLRIPRISRYVPFGYEIDPEDEEWLNPIPKELELLELAKKHLKQYSLRQVSAWLTTQSGREITHDGLRKRIDVERKRKHLTTIKREYARRLQKTLQQIEALEKTTQEPTPTKKTVTPTKARSQPQSSLLSTTSKKHRTLSSDLTLHPQTQYLASSEREVLYGGAAGGGKSYATLADPLRNMNSPDFSGLLVRHTTEELRELIQKSQELYPKAIA